MRLLLTFIAAALLLLGTAMGQGSEPAQADDIVRAAIRRRTAVASTGPFTARLHAVSDIVVRKGDSRFTLIPEQHHVAQMEGSLLLGVEGKGRIRIDARRATALPSGPAGNLLANFRTIAGYPGITGDRVILLNTSIVSPLASDAFDYYTFAITGTAERAGADAYVIEVRPATELVPVFEGTLWIGRERYDLVEADLHISRRTALPFTDELALVERFSPADEGIFMPEHLEIRGTGTITAVAIGMVEPEVTFHVRADLADRRLHAAVPDAMRGQSDPLVTADGADAVPGSFWAGDDMLDADQRAALAQNSPGASDRRFGISAAPYIDYNRVGATSLGGSLDVKAGPVGIGAMGGYSFGLERPIGELSARLEFGDVEELLISPYVRACSRIETTTTGDKSYPRIMNTLVAASLHQDYYDFYRKDGWSAGMDLAHSPLRLGVTYEESRQFSAGNTAQWALLTWKSREFQDNPPIADGRYRTVQGELAWERPSAFLKITPVRGADLRWSLAGLAGKAIETDTGFSLVEALISLSMPVIETGYNPMILTLLGAGGAGTATLPPQYQFRLRTSAASFGKPGGFVSPPKGLYGGTAYLALGAEFNLTDLWWRALHLPVRNGRGVELILAGGGARYRQMHPVGYAGTGDQWYTEAGFALSRIPLFLTDLITGRVDARWGFGPLGRFGANFTFVAPL